MARLIAAAAAIAFVAGCASRPPPPAPAPPPASKTSVPPPPRDIAAIPDAIPRAEPRSLRGNPPFYEVFGKRYTLLPSSEGYVERGIASWYGPGFHAAKTSMGEPYDMYAMTAAHKTLPIPCYARVTNLRNGRSVVVRINDRGPFAGDRIIDLSYTAAAKLDMLREGTALVEVKVLTAGTPAAVVPAPISAAAQESVVRDAAGRLQVQAGAFSAADNAQRLEQKLLANGFAAAYTLAPDGGSRLYRVRIPVTSVAEFDAVVARLGKLGVADARLALE